METSALSSQAAARIRNGEQQDGGDDVHLSTISCDRCRSRKIRCDRKHPCACCVRSGHTCTYPQRHTPREKRQRVLISETYERKIDNIAQKLEEFGDVLEAIQSSTKSAGPSTTPLYPPTHPSPTEFVASTVQTTLSSPTHNSADKLLTPKVVHQGESSLPAQAAFANRFLEDAIIRKPIGADVAIEMSSVLDDLRKTLGKNANTQERDYLYPHSRVLRADLNLRSLPMPPIDKALLCLRMAQENPRVRFFWNHEANCFSAFNEIFLKVYTPGEASHSNLITVNGGLYWLFRECRNVVTDPDRRVDLEAQAIICRDNLETILADLPFHLPSTLETIGSLFIAGLYCLETCKPSAAYHFVTTASHMCQSLGLHSVIALKHEEPNEKLQKIRFFWLIYIQEKTLSLRLGRSSTIRDSDITIPVPGIDHKCGIAWFAQLPKMVNLARIQGKIYDQLYSPAALLQRQDVRTTRARCLASELETHKSAKGTNEKMYLEAMRQAAGSGFVEAFLYTDEITIMSLFCLIYRAIPAKANQDTIFSDGCINSAREALTAHKKCMILVAELDEALMNTYVSWVLLQSPFIPFIVIFCHIIETCNRSDLDLLESVIEALQSAIANNPSSGARKEFYLFKALFDAARGYLEAKSGKIGVHLGPCTATPASTLLPSTSHQQPVLPTPISNFPLEQTPMGPMFDVTTEWMSQSFGAGGAVNMEIDDDGVQLGNWLQMNNDMTRALEESYFWEDFV